MPVGVPLVIEGLSKSFGTVKAVDRLSFSVQPGQVTGFLGPNGAGKTTTLRILLGLVTADAGTATIGGVAYRNLRRPLASVGAALEAASFHPGRSARGHLAIYAVAAGIDSSRVAATLSLVGLAEYADRRVGGFSLGMRQRLGLAFALLGDPGVLVLDEPVNGLDPEGIRWIRSFLRQLAAEGRTVLVSSHLLSEVQQSVDTVVIISHGSLVYQGGLLELETGTRVLVDAPDRAALSAALQAAGIAAQRGHGGLLVEGHSAAEIGGLAHRAGVPLSLLSAEQGGLENAFLALVGEGGAP
jgi:ABC-2 type transport system ATP-binding protein